MPSQSRAHKVGARAHGGPFGADEARRERVCRVHLPVDRLGARARNTQRSKQCNVNYQLTGPSKRLKWKRCDASGARDDNEMCLWHTGGGRSRRGPNRTSSQPTNGIMKKKDRVKKIRWIHVPPSGIVLESGEGKPCCMEGLSAIRYQIRSCQQAE